MGDINIIVQINGQITYIDSVYLMTSKVDKNVCSHVKVCTLSIFLRNTMLYR